MRKLIYLSFTILILFLSCNTDPSDADKQVFLSERGEKIDAQLEKQDIQLSEEEIEKLEKIEEIAKKHNMDVPEEYDQEFAKHIDVWLNMNTEDADGFFKELQTYKLYSERSSEITKKWMPKLKAAETKEEHDKLYREYQNELSELKEEMFGDLERYSDKILPSENQK
jgi:hypothetical protein